MENKVRDSIRKLAFDILEQVEKQCIEKGKIIPVAVVIKENVMKNGPEYMGEIREFVCEDVEEVHKKGMEVANLAKVRNSLAALTIALGNNELILYIRYADGITYAAIVPMCVVDGKPSAFGEPVEAKDSEAWRSVPEWRN